MKKLEDYLDGKIDTIFFDSDRWQTILDEYVAYGKDKLALKCAAVALSQFPFNQLLIIRKAQAYSSMGKLKEALNVLDTVQATDSDLFELYATKGAVFSQLRDSKNAIKFYELALEVADDEEKDEIFIELAMEYETADDVDKAIDTLKAAIKFNPENESAFHELAFLYDWTGDFFESVKCYTEFLDENPYSFTAWYNLGNTYLRVDDYDEAIWAYEYSVVIKDDFGPVFYNLGTAQMETDRFAEAIESFKRNIELDGDEALTYAYIGECYEQLSELELAKENYKKSLSISPLLAEGWLGLGIVEDLEGRTKEGIILIEKAAELDPENGGIYHVLAGAYEKIDQLDRACELYEKSLKLDANDSECLDNYINLLMKFGTKAAYDFILEFRNVMNSAYRKHQVNLLWLMGMKEEAIKQAQIGKLLEEEFLTDLFELNPSLSSVPEFVLLGD